MMKSFGGIENRRARDAVRTQQVDPIVARSGGERLFDQGFEHAPVGDARRILGEALIGEVRAEKGCIEYSALLTTPSSGRSRQISSNMASTLSAIRRSQTT